MPPSVTSATPSSHCACRASKQPGATACVSNISRTPGTRAHTAAHHAWAQGTPGTTLEGILPATSPLLPCTCPWVPELPWANEDSLHCWRCTMTSQPPFSGAVELGSRGNNSRVESCTSTSKRHHVHTGCCQDTATWHNAQLMCAASGLAGQAICPTPVHRSSRGTQHKRGGAAGGRSISEEAQHGGAA